MKNVWQHPWEVNRQERESIRKQDYSFLGQSILACHFGVWNESSIADRERRPEVIVETNRKDFCFFWPYRPGMLLPAATILQEREVADRETSKDRSYTIIGLWIAALALGASVLIEIAKVAGLIK